VAWDEAGGKGYGRNNFDGVHGKEAGSQSRHHIDEEENGCEVARKVNEADFPRGQEDVARECAEAAAR
jgi:hypothetical protein